MRYFFILTLLFFGGIFSAENALAENASVFIQEIQTTGGSGHSNDDFIELFNDSSSAQDITGWKLKKRIKSGTESLIKEFKTDAENEKIILPGNGSLLWTNADGRFSQNTESIFTSSAILSNDYSLALFDADNNLIDSLTYGNGHVNPYSPTLSFPTNPSANQSLERNLEADSFSLQSNPSPTNDAFIQEDLSEEENAEKIYSTDISLRINEIFPNPKEGGEENEYIELFNFGLEEICLSGFILRDSSKTGNYVFSDSTTLASSEYLAIYKKDSHLSLNNSTESISLFTPADDLIDSVEYQKTKEGASFGFDGEKFRWSRHLTPGEANAFDDLPQGRTSIPKKVFVNLPITFSSQGKTDYKYTWDFGDKTKSYQKNVTHTYKKKGRYKGSLTVDNGFEETKKYFTVEVKKYSAKKVSIISLFPDPPGTDSDNEYILIKNGGQKKIDLKNWSIATGTQEKKLANHPIRESFLLKKGETKKLTGEFSSFTLPNRSGFVELRQPDGKVVQKITYQKPDSLEESSAYVLQPDRHWSWIGNPVDETTQKLNDSEEDDSSSLDIHLEDLSLAERTQLEKEVEEKLREKILAEVMAELSTKKEPAFSDLDEAINEETGFAPQPENNLLPDEQKHRKRFFSQLFDSFFLTANASINGILNKKE